MPTRPERKSFWDGAIRCFLNQTYKDSKLLILTEGSLDDYDHLCNGYPYDRIAYSRCSSGLPTGAKRNAVNALVETELIVHWDDDDWYHPERIAEQVRFLDETGKQVVGWHDLLYYRIEDRSLWCYCFQGRQHLPYATGVSMCYRRSWWEKHPFLNDRRVAEDTAFWLDAKGAGVMASTGRDRGFANIKYIVARAHPGNTFNVPRSNPWIPASRESFPEEFLAEEGL